MKLSNALTTQLKELNIDLITNDRVSIPSESSSGSSVWDGSFGLQNGLKTVRLDSGKTLQADFVFISTGNKPNISLVQSKDAGAITQGLIAVDKNLKVRLPPAYSSSPLISRSCPNRKTPSLPRTTMPSVIAPHRPGGKLLPPLKPRGPVLQSSECSAAPHT